MSTLRFWLSILAAVTHAAHAALCWVTIRTTWSGEYQLNTATGARRYQPYFRTPTPLHDEHWIETGRWTPGTRLQEGCPDRHLN